MAALHYEGVAIIVKFIPAGRGLGMSAVRLTRKPLTYTSSTLII